MRPGVTRLDRCLMIFRLNAAIAAGRAERDRELPEHAAFGVTRRCRLFDWRRIGAGSSAVSVSVTTCRNSRGVRTRGGRRQIEKASGSHRHRSGPGGGVSRPCRCRSDRAAAARAARGDRLRHAAALTMPRTVDTAHRHRRYRREKPARERKGRRRPLAVAARPAGPAARQTVRQIPGRDRRFRRGVCRARRNFGHARAASSSRKRNCATYRNSSRRSNRCEPQLEYDDIFARKMQDRPVVLGYTFTAMIAQAGTRKGMLPAAGARRRHFCRPRTSAFLVDTGYTANLHVLQKAAASAGTSIRGSGPRRHHCAAFRCSPNMTAPITSRCRWRWCAWCLGQAPVDAGLSERTASGARITPASSG